MLGLFGELPGGGLTGRHGLLARRLQPGALDRGASVRCQRLRKGEVGRPEEAGLGMVDVQAADSPPTGFDGRVHGGAQALTPHGGVGRKGDRIERPEVLDQRRRSSRL